MESLPSKWCWNDITGIRTQFCPWIKTKRCFTTLPQPLLERGIVSHKKMNKFKPLLILCFITLSAEIFATSYSQAKSTSLPAPVEVRAKSCQEKRLKLTWKKVKGASGCQIYQYRVKAKKFDDYVEFLNRRIAPQIMEQYALLHKFIKSRRR